LGPRAGLDVVKKLLLSGIEHGLSRMSPIATPADLSRLHSHGILMRIWKFVRLIVNDIIDSEGCGNYSKFKN
jgi:hypothetical protein